MQLNVKMIVFAMFALTGRWGVAQESGENLIGVWRVVTVVDGGEETAGDEESGRIEFREDGLMIIGDNGGLGSLGVEFDHTQMPLQIDISFGKDPDEEFTVVMKGIFELDDDGKLARICLNENDGERPEEFESTAENQYVLFTLERIEEDDE